MKLSRQQILFGLLVVVLGGAAYVYFFTGGPAQPLTAVSSASPAEQQFLTLAGQLTPVSFDTSVFTDPRFTSLVDITTAVAPEAQGRIDPFAPLGR